MHIFALVLFVIGVSRVDIDCKLDPICTTDDPFFENMAVDVDVILPFRERYTYSEKFFGYHGGDVFLRWWNSFFEPAFVQPECRQLRLVSGHVVQG